MKNGIEFTHEPKVCQRCQSLFECKVGNTEQCQCGGLALEEDVRKHIRQIYNDCLCITCLKEIRSEQAIKSFYGKIKKLLGIFH